MRLEELHRLISFELKRGTALDSMIPLYVKQAVTSLERNWAMKYMEEWVQINLAPEDQTVDMVWAYRSFRFLRYEKAGDWKYLTKQDSSEEILGDQELAKYSQIGMRYVRFNTAWYGTAPLRLEGVIYKMTDWQHTKPDFRHFLLDQASDLLTFGAMVRIAASLRDPRIMELYRPLLAEGLRTFLNMDQDAEYDGRKDEMVYTGGSTNDTPD